MQLLKAKSNDKKPSIRKPACLELDSLPKPKALSRRPASERKHRKKKLRNSSENIRKQPEKGSLSTQSHVLLRVSSRKRKGLTFEDGPGHNSTEEDIKDQKTLKKSLLRNFLEGTRRDIKGKHLKQLQEFRKLNKNSEDFSKKPEFQLSKKSIDSSQRESKTNSIKFNAEAVKVFEQKKERLDKADLSYLLFSDFPDIKEKELSVFRACDLFDKLHEETANPELKKVKNNIELFYKTSLPNKVPPTDLSNYKLIKLIGKGSFGKVYLGVQLLTSRLVAIKCLEKNNIRDPGVRSKILQEIDVLKAANQVPQVTQLLEVFENTSYVFLVIVYAKGGDLLRYIKSKTRLSEDEAKNVFLKTLMGVCGLHARGILHRDIKLDNILLDEKQDPTICDFGVSRKMKDREVINEQCGTPAYIAPEIIQETGYSGLKADVWSMGVMLYAMLIGKMPFKGSTISDLHVSITTAGFKFPQEPKISFEAKDLISKMMVVDPSQRLSSFEVLRHKWIGLDSSEADVILQKTSDNRVFIEENLLNQVTKYGFSIDGVRESLLSKKLNHATACYYNLQHCLASG